MSFGSVKVIDNVAVAAGATNAPIVVPMDDTLQSILIYVVHKGASGNLAIDIGSSPDGIINAPIQPLTLDSTSRPVEIQVDIVPGFLIFTAKNNGAVSTAYDVIISKRA